MRRLSMSGIEEKVLKVAEDRDPAVGTVRWGLVWVDFAPVLGRSQFALTHMLDPEGELGAVGVWMLEHGEKLSGGAHGNLTGELVQN